MNYREFMLSVDKRMSEMSEREKNNWIYEIVRETRENQRDKMLHSLNNLSYPEEDFAKSVEVINSWCNKVEDGTLYFESSDYEDYASSDRDSDYIVEYYDPNGIGESLENFFEIVERLMYKKNYKEAVKLCERLCALVFGAADDDAGEYTELTLQEVVEEDLAQLNLNRIGVCLMYSQYQLLSPKYRAEKLYKYLSQEMFKKIKVEEIFMIGPCALEGTNDFIENFVNLLKNKKGDRAGELLVEVLLYQGGTNRLSSFAKEVVNQHPIVYLVVCQRLLEEKRYQECEELGLEALKLMFVKFRIRAEILNVTRCAAKKLSHEDIVNQCSLEAFYSNSSLSHYLKLFEQDMYKKAIDDGAKYIEKLPRRFASSRPSGYHQLEENGISGRQADIIRFFHGEFDYILNKCKNDHSIHNISGLILQLLMLQLNKNAELTKAGQRLVKKITQSLDMSEEQANAFPEQFLLWKRKMQLDEKQQADYLLWLEQQVEKSAESLVGNDKSKSGYRVVAELVVTLGEAMEANGKLNGKMVLVEHYRKLYFRKKSFKAELEKL